MQPINQTLRHVAVPHAFLPKQNSLKSNLKKTFLLVASILSHKLEMPSSFVITQTQIVLGLSLIGELLCDDFVCVHARAYADRKWPVMN